jgi:hypothetical protein
MEQTIKIFGIAISLWFFCLDVYYFNVDFTPFKLVSFYTMYIPPTGVDIIYKICYKINLRNNFHLNVLIIFVIF